MDIKHIVSAGLGLYESMRFYRNMQNAKHGWTDICMRKSDRLKYQLVKAALIAQAEKRIRYGKK